MDNYQAMNFYYGLLNLHAGLFRANLCEILMVIAQSVPDTNQQPETAYHTAEEKLNEDREQLNREQVEFGSFYEDGHILHNVKITTQSDFFLDPTRQDTVKWHVSFTVAKDVRPADQFIVQLSPNLMVAPNGHPEQPIPDFVDQDGVVIAMGAYDRDKHELVYTFTNYVTDHREIMGELAGQLAIDPLTTPENEFGLECFISVDDYRKDFTIDVDYPDLADDMFLGISSRMMDFDIDHHLFTDVIYVNPAQQDLNHAYIVFNTSDMVEELSNVIVKPSTIRIEIYRNSRGLKLPQSYGVNFQRLRDITNRFPIVEGDHLVETPYTMSFADNKLQLNLGAGKTNDSYVIKVVGQYNDELDGTVRLRARLFGMDEQNVYMSNSTAATAVGVPMEAHGHAIAKEELGETTVAAFADNVEDLKRDDMTADGQDFPEEEADEPSAAPVSEEPVAPTEDQESPAPVEDENENLSAEEEELVEPTESIEESADAIPDEEEGDEPTSVVDEVAEEEPDSSAYIVSFASGEDDNSDLATPAEEEGAESMAIGGDELSISFDIGLQAEPAEGDAVEESAIEEAPVSAAEEDQPQSEEPVEAAEPAQPVSAEPEIKVEVTAEDDEVEEETSAAPLPMPGRRPPRRRGRFQTNSRMNHSLRHLRRF